MSSSTTTSFDTAAAELRVAAALAGVDASTVATVVTEPSASFAATRVLSGQAISHNASSVTALGHATAALAEHCADAR